MNKPVSVLQTLLGDMPLDEFLQRHYLQAPLVRAGTTGSFAELTSSDAAFALIERSECEVAVVRDGAVYHGRRPRTATAARAHLEEGFTLAFRHAERHDPRLCELGRRMSTELLGRINLHVYWTPAHHGSFGWHCDPEEIFILQTSGGKTYFVRENTVHPHPLAGAMPSTKDLLQETSPVQEHRLSAGDFLYIPGGFWHSTRADSESLSISIGVLPPTPLDLLEMVRSQLAHQPSWRRRIGTLGLASPLSDPDKLQVLRHELLELGQTLSTALADVRAAPLFLSAWARTSLAECAVAPPDRSGSPARSPSNPRGSRD